MRIRHACLLASLAVVLVLLAGCGKTKKATRRPDVERAAIAALGLHRVLCTTSEAHGPFAAAAEAQAAGARSLYQAGNFARVLRVASRHLDRSATVTSVSVEPGELDVNSVFAGQFRSFRVGVDGSYSVKQSGPLTQEAAGFYLSQIRADDVAILLRGLSAAVGLRPSQVQYVLVQPGPGVATLDWTAWTDSGSVEVSVGQVQDNAPCNTTVPTQAPRLVVPTNPPPAGSPLAIEAHDDPALMKPNDPRSIFFGNHFARMLTVVRRHLGNHVWVRSFQLQPGYALLLIVRHGWETVATVSYDGFFSMDSSGSSRTGSLPGFYLSEIDPRGLSILTRESPETPTSPRRSCTA